MPTPDEALLMLTHPEVESERRRQLHLGVPCLFDRCEHPVTDLLALVIEQPNGQFGVATWPDGMICAPHTTVVFEAISDCQPMVRRDMPTGDGSEFAGQSWAERHPW